MGTYEWQTPAEKEKSERAFTVQANYLATLEAAVDVLAAEVLKYREVAAWAERGANIACEEGTGLELNKAIAGIRSSVLAAIEASKDSLANPIAAEAVRKAGG